MFAKRLIKPELLDHAEPTEALPNLADLVRINRNFGGHGVLRKMLARVAPREKPFTLLDVGAASGDSARLIQELYPAAQVTNLDRNETNLGAAGWPKVLGDAFQLPFRDNSFDFVHSSLFLHHFPDEEVIALLAGFYRLARQALLVNDLERRLLPYCFLPATKYLFGWQRITLHDGPISVRAAFRAEELAALSRRAGIQTMQVEVHRPAFRISLVANKNGSFA
ncbi:MAG: methyltransferase domain-containing protein [Bryobacteraceae bacterium]